MTHRELPRVEWDRLKGTDLELLCHPTMERITRILVVENAEGEIVGHWALINWWHAEGLGIREQDRGNPAIARHLLIGLRRMAAEMTPPADVVYTAAERGEKGERVRALLEHVDAVPIPADAFFLPVRTAVLR